MKYQILFTGKNEKNFITLSSAKLAQIVIKVNERALLIYDPHHQETYLRTCVPTEDSDQSAHFA